MIFFLGSNILMEFFLGSSRTAESRCWCPSSLSPTVKSTTKMSRWWDNLWTSTESIASRSLPTSRWSWSSRGSKGLRAHTRVSLVTTGGCNLLTVGDLRRAYERWIKIIQYKKRKKLWSNNWIESGLNKHWEVLVSCSEEEIKKDSETTLNL